MESDDHRWVDLSAALTAERASASFMSMLLDHELVARARMVAGAGARVLDYGAGDGQLAIAVAADGADVDAFEPTPSQFEQLRATLQGGTFAVTPLADPSLIQGPYDLLMCINVLDHVEDWTTTVGQFVEWVRPGGRLFIVVPHPLKDWGDWFREQSADPATSYRHYILHDYLQEGVVHKVREDRFGNVVARNLPSHHRTVSTYFNGLRRAGLDIVELQEPGPDPIYRGLEPVLYVKASRIPYFLYFDCVLRTYGPAGIYQ